MHMFEGERLYKLIDENTDYIITRANTLEDLTYNVAILTEHGYVPTGAPFPNPNGGLEMVSYSEAHHTYRWYQAMFRKDALR